MYQEQYRPQPQPESVSLRTTEPSAWQQFRNELDVEYEDELESFINGKPTSCKLPLDWWLQHQNEYPGLSRMAIDILSIPAMSADSERVFSGARRTVSWDRSSLNEETIEHTECIKSWDMYLEGLAS